MDKSSISVTESLAEILPVNVAAERCEKTRSLLYPSVMAVQMASGLDDNVAKACVYYAVGTYGLEQLETYPILVLLGPAGTGKSSAMQVMKQLANRPIWLPTRLTKASLRDELGNAKNATAFIEEADNVDEEIIANRYSRETAKTGVKRTVPPGGWVDTKVDYFGATVLHRRQPFKDLAISSRSIAVRTRNRLGNYQIPNVDESYRENIRKLWEQAKEHLSRYQSSSRAGDVWKLLIAVAITVGDSEWLAYALGEVTKATESLRFGQEFEPEQAVVSAIIGHSEKEMVALFSIREWLKREYNWQPSAWTLGDIIRNLGFEVKTSHGERKVVINKKLLSEVVANLGIEDDSIGQPDLSFKGLH